MGWFYPKKKKSAEWKQESTMQTMATVSLSPTLHLLMILGIVIGLLWLSHFEDYKAHHTAIYFQLLLLFSPILLILFLISYSTRRLNLCLNRSVHEPLRRAVMSPWNVATLLLMLLLLISYQSSFHSKWFGPLLTSD